MQIISSSDITFLNNDSVLYDLQQTGSTGVLIRLTSNELTENSTFPQLSSVDVPDNVLLYNEETKLFIPGCELQYIIMYNIRTCELVKFTVCTTCRCKSIKESVRTICIGPSISPCNWSQTSCEVNNFHVYY